MAAVLAVALAACASPPPTPSASSVTPSVSIGPSPATPATLAPSTPPGGTASPIAGPIREVRFDAPRAPAGDAAGPIAKGVVVGDTAFALRLYSRLAKGRSNLIYSPFSISTALSMTLAGARGTTAEQLAATLGTGNDLARWNQGRNDLDQWLGKPPPANLDPGFVPLQIEPTDALFGQDGLAFQQPYLEVLARDYGAGLQACDFALDPDACRTAINGWVAERTAQKIRDLLGRGTVNELTRFVLVNAILFKASWAQPFEPSQTRGAPFHLLEGGAVNVTTMHGTIQAVTTRGNGWRALDVPYIGATMTVIVPDTGRFQDVERGLDPQFLATVDSHHTYDLVHLSMPRWSSTTSAELVPVLQALGIHDLFDPRTADLRGIADIPLSVTHVVHQATIKVDEAGTEAAAATAVVGDTTGGKPDHEVTIQIDRPFMYFIRDGASNEILFAGRVLDPRGS